MNLLISRITIHWISITLFLFVLVAVLSLWPAQELPKVPGTDKTHHFIAYASIAFPIAVARPKHWWLGIILIILVSGVIELIQPYMNRYGEWLDLLANASGVCIGVLSGYICSRIVGSAKLGSDKN